MILTNRGRVLQAKAQTGVPLQFTAIKIGDGQLGGQYIPTLNGLISPKMTLGIGKLQPRPDGKAIVGTYLSNADLTTGFYFREIGLFANDPDVGEILYCYANSGSAADYIPAGGGPDVVERYIDLVAIVQDAPNVSAVIDNSLAFTSFNEFEEHKNASILDHPDGSVTTAKLAAKAVTQAKIADNAVGSGQIADNAVTDAKIGTRTVNDTATPSFTGQLTTLISGVFNLIKGITGKSSALTPPATTLEDAKAHMDAAAPHSGHAIVGRKINTSGGLTGGGDLSADRTLSIADGGVTDAKIGNRTITDTTAPAGDSGSLTSLFGWLGYMIKAITGKSSWRTAPATTLEAAKAHMDATAGVHGATSAATAGTIIQRDASGRAKVAAPSAADDIARKAEVDAAISTAAADATTKANAVQANLTAHANATTGVHGATSAATANALIQRDASGRAKVAAPAAADDIARKDTVDNAIAALKNETSTLTATLQHGPNLIQTDQASPLAATVYGRTLVNLLGKDGGCESLAPFTISGTVDLSSTQKRSGSNSMRVTSVANSSYARKDYDFTLDTAKQYILGAWVFIESYTSGTPTIRLFDKGTNDSSALRYSVNANTSKVGVWQFVYIKIPTANTLMGSGFRLFVGNYFSGTSVVYFDEIRLYELSAADYNAIGTTYSTPEQIDAFIPYVDSVQHLQGSAIQKAGKNLLPPGTEAYSINAAWSISEPYKATLVRSATGQYLTFRVPCLPNQQYTLSYSGASSGILRIINAYNSSGAMTNLASNAAVGVSTVTTPVDAVTLEVQFSAATNGTYELSNWQLELGSTATAFEPRNDDYAYIPTKLASSIDGSVRDSFDTRTRQVTRRWKTDVVLDGSLNWIHVTGFTGYKRVAAVAFPQGAISGTNGFVTKYTGAPLVGYVSSSSWASADLWLQNAADFNVTIASADSGWGDSYTPSAAEIKAYFLGWRMNNGTFGQPYNGSGTKTWVPLNATDNSGAVTTVPTTPSSAITSGAYDYYRLSYQLSTPVTEPVEGYEGLISLHAGGNVVELLEGVITREKASPVLFEGEYFINNIKITGTNLKNRVDRILAVYKGAERDAKWKIQTHANGYGNQIARISAADYDPTAEYFVTYIALDKYALTANATEAKVEYRTNIGGVVGDLVQRMADNETKDSVQDWADTYIQALAENNAFDIAAIKSQYLGYGTTAGTGTAYTLTLSPAPSALVAGMRVTVKIHTANTGAATLNVNGLGAKSIKKANGNDVAAGNLKSGGVYTLVYDGTNFILQGEGGEYGTATAADVLAGKTIGTENGLVTGTMPNMSGSTQSMSTLDDGTGNKMNYIDSVSEISQEDQAMAVTFTPPQGYYDGSTAKIKLRVWGPKPNVIAAGQKIGWVNNAPLTGTYTSDANAAAGDILSGKTAYVNGQKITGNMPNLTGIRNATGTARWPNGDLAVYPERGYQKGGAGDGEIRVTTAQLQAADGSLAPQNIVSGATIFGVVGTAIVGRRSASGIASVETLPSDGNYFITSYGGYSSVRNYIFVTGISFTPSIIVAFYNTAGNWTSGTLYYKDGFFQDNPWLCNILMFGQYLDPFTTQNGAAYVLGGFGFMLPIYPKYQNLQVKWIAIE